MNIHSPQEFGRAASRDAVFATLRARLAGEVSSSAMLAELLEKLNGMQEAQARPADFTKRFDAFVARADEHLDVVRPFFPVLVQFLPTHKESLAARKGGRPAKLSPKEIKTIRPLLKTAAVPVAEIAARFGIARSTLYRAVLKPA
jgi:Helix-turn-helix domain of resolvase